MLDALAAGGLRALPAVHADLDAYRREMRAVRPDELSRDEALAFWINLNNAEAVALATEASEAGLTSIVQLGDAFRRKVTAIDGERLSLADIEHGKLRRFRDPRIHTALVCGSLSCPTLRPEPFTGAGLDEQLDQQARSFLAAGGAVASGTEVSLSRVFLWYGADFVRPHRMPALLPVGRKRVARALVPWLADAERAVVEADGLRVTFQPYDWGLGCAVR